MPIERVGSGGTAQPIAGVERVAADGSTQPAVAVERIMADGTLQEVWPPDTGGGGGGTVDAEQYGGGSYGEGIYGEESGTGGDDLATQFETAIHSEINDYRASQGLTAYGYRSEVADVARAHSKDMHDRDYFAHTNPDGDGPGDRLDAAGVNNTNWAENISWRSRSSITEDDVATLSADIVQGWIDSTSGHRENLESSMDSEGIGVFINADATELWATELITSP